MQKEEIMFNAKSAAFSGGTLFLFHSFKSTHIASNISVYSDILKVFRGHGDVELE